MSRPHQPGQAAFRSVLPDDIDWKPFAAFPPPARLAVVVGQPTEPGPYVIRVKVPSGVKLMPHRHPEDRVYTVISGVFYIGLGDEFDGDDVTAYPPGSVTGIRGPGRRPAGATSVGSAPASRGRAARPGRRTLPGPRARVPARASTGATGTLDAGAWG